MYLYVYKIVDITNGEFYIGSRKSLKEPLKDKYMGSPNVWKPVKENLVKSILKEGFNSIEEMIECEASYIESNIKDPLNQNYRIPNSKFYNKQGNCGKSNGAFGRKWINNGNEVKYVKKEELEEYIRLGWKLGHLHKTGFSTKGRVWLTNGVENKYILKEEVDEFLTIGWYLGKTYSPEGLNKIKHTSSQLAAKYKKENSERMSNTMLNAIWMNDGDKNRRVKKEIVSEKLNMGWKLGRVNYVPHNKIKH